MNILKRISTVTKRIHFKVVVEKLIKKLKNNPMSNTKGNIYNCENLIFLFLLSINLVLKEVFPVNCRPLNFVTNCTGSLKKPVKMTTPNKYLCFKRLRIGQTGAGKHPNITHCLWSISFWSGSVQVTYGLLSNNRFCKKKSELNHKLHFLYKRTIFIYKMVFFNWISFKQLHIGYAQN